MNPREHRAITRLTFAQDEGPSLTAERTVWEHDPDRSNVNVVRDTATADPIDAAQLLTTTPRELNLEDESLGSILAYLGNAVHDAFAHDRVVNLRVTPIDAHTGRPIVATVTVQVRDESVSQHSAFHNEAWHTTLVVPMALAGTIVVSADGYHWRRLTVSLLKDARYYIRMTPVALASIDDAWLTATKDRLEAGEALLNRFCTPTEGVFEETRTMLSVAISAARLLMLERDTAHTQVPVNSPDPEPDSEESIQEVPVE